MTGIADRVLSVVNDGAAPDEATRIVLTLARAHAALLNAGAPLVTVDVMKTAVRLAMSGDMGTPLGSVTIERARYAALDYWLRRMV